MAEAMPVFLLLFAVLCRGQLADDFTAGPADVPALIVDHIFGASAEDAGRLILFQHDAVSVHINFPQ